MRRIRANEQKRMPWKNGGGVTNEILVEPGGNGRFAYRVSIAEVGTDGPFSRFEGYERHICLLDGAGMVLEAADNGSIELLPFVPRRFDGDWDIYGRLVGGPVRDFNLIVDRGWGRASLEVVEAEGPLVVEADICLVHVVGRDTFVANGRLELDIGTGRVAIARLSRGGQGHET